MVSLNYITSLYFSFRKKINIEKLAKVIFGPDYKGGFAAMANSIANLAGDGLTRLNNLVEGKNFSTENIRELGKDILGAAGVLGAFGFFVSGKEFVCTPRFKDN